MRVIAMIATGSLPNHAKPKLSETQLISSATLINILLISPSTQQSRFATACQIVMQHATFFAKGRNFINSMSMLSARVHWMDELPKPCLSTL